MIGSNAIAVMPPTPVNWRKRPVLPLTAGSFLASRLAVPRVLGPSPVTRHAQAVALGFACFPLTAIVSLVYVMNDGGSAEIALVNNDGMLGVTSFAC
jgi:hypothetical protein